MNWCHQHGTLHKKTIANGIMKMRSTQSQVQHHSIHRHSFTKRSSSHSSTHTDGSHVQMEEEDEDEEEDGNVLEAPNKSNSKSFGLVQMAFSITFVVGSSCVGVVSLLTAWAICQTQASGSCCKMMYRGYQFVAISWIMEEQQIFMPVHHPHGAIAITSPPSSEFAFLLATTTLLPWTELHLNCTSNTVYLLETPSMNAVHHHSIC